MGKKSIRASCRVIGTILINIPKIPSLKMHRISITALHIIEVFSKGNYQKQYYFDIINQSDAMSFTYNVMSIEYHFFLESCLLQVIHMATISQRDI